MSEKIRVFYQIGDRFNSSDTLNNLNFSVLNFSRRKGFTIEKTRDHTHGFLEVFIFEQGEGCISINNKVIKVDKNRILIIDANTLHRQYSTSNENPLIYYNLTIDALNFGDCKPNCLASAVEGNRGKGYYFIPIEEEKSSIFKIVQDLMRELDEKQRGYKLKTFSMFYILFIEIIRLMSFNETLINKRESAVMKKNILDIKKYIEENYAEDLTIDIMAQKAFVSKSYLLHQFKNKFLVSPMQYLKIIRLSTAQKLLSTTNKPITEIATLVGYNNSVYFSELFLKNIGITPTLYRQISCKKD